MKSVLKSVTVLGAGAVLSTGLCLFSAASAFANQSSLAAVTNQGAFISETASTITGHNAKSRVDKDSAKSRVDSNEFDRLKANLDDAIKEHGANSWTAFVKGRYLLQWYIDQNQLDNAVPLCESLVEYCRESAGTTIGADSFASSASTKQDRNNLILCLTVLSGLTNRLGQSEKSAEMLEDARNTYKDYQLRNFESRAQSFDQFIEQSSVPNTVRQSKLSSLLNWREY